MTEKVIEIEGVAKQFWVVELERIFGLDFKNVFRHIQAVREVSLTALPGQVYGFLGPNGAGKTTTIKMCMDLIRPTKGRIRLFGSDPRDPKVKARIGYLPEHPYFYDYLKPQEILDYFGRIFGIPSAARKRRIDLLLDRVGLTYARNRALRKFSKGMLQRLGVAQALINDPDLLVLDEPLSGLDPMGRKEIRDIIIEERSRGKTIFFSSHILSDIEHLCDRVAIVVQGRIRNEGLLRDLFVSGMRQTEVVVRGSGTALREVFDRAGGGTDLGDGITKVVLDTDHLSPFLQAVLNAGAEVDQVQPHRDSLEDLFLRTAEAS